jgi:hypothetical protein
MAESLSDDIHPKTTPEHIPKGSTQRALTKMSIIRVEPRSFVPAFSRDDGPYFFKEEYK